MIKTEHLHIDGTPFRSVLKQQIPILEDKIIELSKNIGKLNKQLKDTHEEEKLWRSLMSEMSFKTRQLLIYRNHV
jgi:hypothetical protein